MCHLAQLLGEGLDDLDRGLVLYGNATGQTGEGGHHIGGDIGDKFLPDNAVNVGGGMHIQTNLLELLNHVLKSRTVHAVIGAYHQQGPEPSHIPDLIHAHRHSRMGRDPPDQPLRPNRLGNRL